MNHISIIMVGDQILESREEIESTIVNFYNHLYTGDNWNRPRPDGLMFNKLSPQKAMLIEGGFLEEEIKEATFGLGNDRAPSPDGLQVAFFQQF